MRTASIRPASATADSRHLSGAPYGPPEAHARGPLAILLSGGTLWLFATLFFALLLYYFIGVDQGAASIFGHDRHIHEFVHDSRHFLAFPCH